MKSSVASRILIATAAGSAMAAMAHPGHGNPEVANAVIHFLSEPDHVAAVIAIFVAVVTAVVLVVGCVRDRQPGE